MTVNLKRIWRRVRNLAVPPPAAPAPSPKTSWSQSGEDLIVEYLFRLRQIEAPLCLDIGAYHPFFANNTYKFFLKGARAVNVDANPAAIQLFRKTRPGDINLNIGIGAKGGVFDFYLMEDESLNTFSEPEKRRLESMGHRLKEVQRIQVCTVNEVLEKHFGKQSPDFLSVDAEGVDEAIITTFDFSRFAPKVICIETINYTPDGTGNKRTDLCRLIESKGYFEYANTNINSIFVQTAWWFSKRERPIEKEYENVFV